MEAFGAYRRIKGLVLIDYEYDITHQQKIIGHIKQAHHLSQSDLAQIVGVSRFKISRAEAGKCELSTSEWWNLIKHFNLDYDCPYKGLISTEVSPSQSEIFKVPYRFSHNAFTGGRIIHFHLANFENIFGKKGLEEFCLKEKLNPLYLVNINNPLNINFNMVLMQTLIMKGHLNSQKVLEDYVYRGVASMGHNYKIESLFSGSGVKNILKLVAHADLFEQNHDFIIEDYTSSGHSVTVSFRPKEHVDLRLYRQDPFLGNLFCPMIRYYFEAMAKSPMHVTKQACFHKGDKFCTYTFNGEA